MLKGGRCLVEGDGASFLLCPNINIELKGMLGCLHTVVNDKQIERARIDD